MTWVSSSLWIGIHDNTDTVFLYLFRRQNYEYSKHTRSSLGSFLQAIRGLIIEVMVRRLWDIFDE